MVQPRMLNRTPEDVRMKGKVRLDSRTDHFPKPAGGCERKRINMGPTARQAFPSQSGMMINVDLSCYRER